VTAVRGAVVLGMHRSGTSAAAGVVNLLGIPMLAEDDLLSPDSANPKGYWESDSLRVFNDALFEAVGRSWTLPPPRPIDWARDERVEPLRRQALVRFASEFGRGEWAWKDPRACLTLPFWLGAFEVEPTIVLVYRDPLEVATSLARRDGLELRRGLALWERYVRLSLVVARGHATFVTGYEELVEDPAGWAVRLGAFLRSRGFGVRDLGAAELATFVDPALRRSRGGDRGFLSSEQLELARALVRLNGEHERLQPPSLGPETEWVENVLTEAEVAELRGRAERAERSASEFARSRSYRATAPARWLAVRALSLLQSARRATAQ
jgi:hypothetical protein